MEARLRHSNHSDSQASSTSSDAPPRSEAEVWALLLSTDRAELARATKHLETKLVKGIRHFSALGRVVPLEQAALASKEIAAIEREVSIDECLVAPR